MEIRELLQTEIWSKETSRKILARIWKILVGLKYVGMSLVVAFLGFALWIFISTHWLTRGERKIGKITLAQVDALQNSDEMGDVEFLAGSKQAEENVKAAYVVAFTGRDRVTAFYLDIYLDELKHVRQYEKMREKLDYRSRYVRSDRSKELDGKIEGSNRDSIKLFGESLHQSLDR
jgi:hypothetical protein